jgi:plasmid stabilization system protein ParE
MGWNVIFSMRSQQDLRRIVEHIAGDDPASAERFGLALIAKAELLAWSARHPGASVQEPNVRRSK